MILSAPRRTVPLAVCLAFILLATFSFLDTRRLVSTVREVKTKIVGGSSSDIDGSVGKDQTLGSSSSSSSSSSPSKSSLGQRLPPIDFSPPASLPPPSNLGDADEDHRELFSVGTSNGQYMSIDFLSQPSSSNANLIPHPTKTDTWIIVAQKGRSDVANTVWFAQLVCDAVRVGDEFKCTEPPLILPIAASQDGQCKQELAIFNANIGPHDARIFYGPDRPYALWGSQSAYACFGLYLQDFRTLYDWGLELVAGGRGSKAAAAVASAVANENSMATTKDENKDKMMKTRLPFYQATEIQRPPPWGEMEKNWFLFWDPEGKVYVHHNIVPSRVFAALKPDGSVGKDLAPKAQKRDQECMKLHMPPIRTDEDTIHQATNSLRVTLCARHEGDIENAGGMTSTSTGDDGGASSTSSCKPDDSNTFTFTIFQHKTFKDWHFTYEPYVMLFRQTAPFEIYAISTKPFWIHGRGRRRERQSRSSSDNGGSKRSGDIRSSETDSGAKKRGVAARSAKDEDTDDNFSPFGPVLEPEFFYVTSINWAGKGNRYDGFLDDTLHVGFGVDDASAGVIDVRAVDLFRDLAFCGG